MIFPALEVKNISLEITDGTTKRNLLSDVSFNVDPGEVVGITGPSGSGKSTLLSIIGCLETATSGSATLHSEETMELGTVSGRQAAEIRRRHLGIVFQQPNLLPALNAKEQLMVMSRLDKPFGISGKVWRQQEEKAERLLKEVGLEGRENAKVSELSGGQQARVNLARAMMNDPALLLVDEPTAALDTANAQHVTELIVDLARERNTPVLYVSHDQEQLATLDRRIELVDGKASEAAPVTT
ncbi:ABC transporter ATP-binding protein [Corynebacterium macclintockiae]|uniref:ABC transporter ATP-binding protein n=1 Tax=Corynebacterium macclintockiae TaxID=2913501 RepID=UPI00254D1412|nr:ABC transporter ATP-binding protein [Corynebacterium macclintockiae]MDK8890541.1 ABC transporter ATP-binding protein [Corynebacterium macclintockiae]